MRRQTTSLLFLFLAALAAPQDLTSAQKQIVREAYGAFSTEVSPLTISRVNQRRAKAETTSDSVEIDLFAAAVVQWDLRPIPDSDRPKGNLTEPQAIQFART